MGWWNNTNMRNTTTYNTTIHFIETRLQYNWHNNKNADSLVNRLTSNLVILNQAHRVAWLIGWTHVVVFQRGDWSIHRYTYAVTVRSCRQEVIKPVFVWCFLSWNPFMLFKKAWEIIFYLLLYLPWYKVFKISKNFLKIMHRLIKTYYY